MSKPEPNKKKDRITLSLVVGAWVLSISVVVLGSGFTLSDAATHLHGAESSAHIDGKHTLPAP